MIQYFSAHETNLTLLPSDLQIEDASWVNVEAPNEADIKTLTTQFNLPKNYFTAILDDQENSRISGNNLNEKQPLTVLMQYPKYTTSPLGYIEYSTYPIQFILTNNVIITVSKHPAAFIQHFIMHQHKLSRIIQDREKFLSQIFWFISHDFVNALNETAKKMDLLERQLTSATQNSQIYQIMAIQKSLIEFQTALEQNQTVLSKTDSTDAYFNDNEVSFITQRAMIENQQAQTMVDKQSRVLDQYSNMISSVISNNLNDVMKKLTSITIILTVPTIIGGLYGMNVALPYAHIVGAFTWILVMTIVICVVTMQILKRHNYM